MLSILLDGSLELTAPAGSRETAILQKVEKRLTWIRAQRRNFPTLPKRWGSALPNGPSYLNPELIHAPSACVDYVITHGHSRHFQSLPGQLLPDWKTLKARLERAEA